MTLVQLWCSQSNPTDGTALGTSPAGFQTPTTGSGTTRIWHTADAWQANTGVHFTPAGQTDALRTSLFTANASAAFTGVLTIPSATPSASISFLNPRTASGVGFRFQWSNTDRLYLYDTGSSVRTVAGTGVLSHGQKVLFQTWFKQSTTTTGEAHVKVSDLLGNVIATYDATTINLGTNPFTHFDLDPGGFATDYGWSEIQYQDGATGFIAPYTSSTPLAATGSGSVTGSAAISTTVAVSASSTGDVVGSATISSTVSITAAGTSDVVGSASCPAVVAVNAAGSGTAVGSATISVGTSLVVSGAGSPVGSAAVTAMVAVSASGNGSPTGTATVAGANPNIAARGIGTPTGSVALAATINLAAAGSATSSGTATIQILAPITASGSGSPVSTATIQTTTTMPSTGFGSSSGSVTVRATVTITTTGNGTPSGSVSLSNGLVTGDRFTVKVKPREFAGKITDREFDGAIKSREYAATIGTREFAGAITPRRWKGSIK